MRSISRRQMLTTTGLTVGGGLLAIHGNRGQADETKSNEGQVAATTSDAILGSSESMTHYTQISSKKAADLTYQLFPEGSCMYAVVRGIISLVAEKKQTTISPMFYNLFKYGHGGCAGWGSLCGACNGAAAVMGLFCNDKKTCDAMVTELFRWYESTMLPEYVPAGATSTDYPTSVSESILCHASTNQWCRAAKVDVFSPERKERCMRLAADVTKKTVEILNVQYATDPQSMQAKKADEAAGQDACPMGPPDSCIACHSTPGGEPDSFQAEAPKTVTKMNCTKCHYMAPGHPESMGPQMPR